MVFPDLLKEEESCAFGVEGGMCQDEVCMLGEAVDNTHNCVIAMGFRQLDYEVYADYLPWCIGCL
jgi:hypothetical protein